ncbi:hypothetical protein SVI_2717 [Shewanella violacea DSS12]|uniref:Uncharacterized protein n=1 Tax=Shewanella violacea (strain JCM 10179 / CIP 106290 / LMG 19151 / DSS12) TaxID=637905 RepID=D4ZLY9_SHEVD|nr:hypothetical protein SVI_2717 [Shewanella violacea DSS12]
MMVRDHNIAELSFGFSLPTVELRQVMITGQPGHHDLLIVGMFAIEVINPRHCYQILMLSILPIASLKSLVCFINQLSPCIHPLTPSISKTLNANKNQSHYAYGKGFVKVVIMDKSNIYICYIVI